MSLIQDPVPRIGAAPAAFGLRAFRLYAVVLCALGMGVLVALSVRAADGQLIYSLDDPYIHLAVAETILRGGYGVNFPEVSAPSSSVLWPWLLAPFLALGLGSLAPLLIGMAASLALAWIAAPVLHSRGVPAASPEFWLLPPLFLVAVNAVALPMTGMEHALHLLAVGLAVVGLIELGDRGRVGPALVLGAVLSGLIRFEGLALSLSVMGILLAVRRPRPALLIGGALGLALAAHAAFMLRAGLPVLPSSVLVKSNLAADLVDAGGLPVVGQLLSNLFVSLTHPWGIVFAGTVVALLLALWRGAARWPLPVACILALGAHLAVGRYGWFGRYEAYAAVLAVLTLFHVFGDRLRALWPTLLPLLLAVVAVPFALIAWTTPAASRNIFEQQYTMHRIATEILPETVAVNDLGWVAWRNDQYVLDLWGLGSEEARRAMRASTDMEAYLRDMTTRTGAAYAMIYPEWFGNRVPPEWCSIAALRTSKVTAASPEVSLFLIDRSHEERMRAGLADLAPTLPAGARIETFACE